MTTPMMAIGDSLFNGVRSLTINQTLAQWSAPAQVARALGIPFASPDYPRNVVVNFEHWLADFPNLIGIVADLVGNIEFWDQNPKSNLPQFDNIAIASTVYADLWTRTAHVAQTEIAGLHASLGAGFNKAGTDIAGLFFAFNTRFLLNPTGDPGLADLSSIDIVARRQPERLLVSIGANNGLWEMGFAAEASAGIGGSTGPFNSQDLADLKTLISKLASLPRSVKHIYVNALPVPSMVANMMPVPDVSDTDPPGPGKYYPVYENRFGFNYATLTSSQMAANDAAVTAVNTLLRKEAASADARIHIVPIDQVFAAYDYKTNHAARTVSAGGKTLSNIMLEGPHFLFPQFWRGGLIGLDGMHPTIVGYAIVAAAIIAAIQQYEPEVSIQQPNFLDAYQADSLLQKVPLSWDLVLDLSLDIRRGLAHEAAAGAPTGEKNDAVANLLDVLKFKID